MDLDSIFGNMEKASVSDKGTFYNGGLYLNELISIEYREGFKGKSCIAKFKVLESNNEEDEVGSTRTWIVKLDNARTKDQAMGDIKGLIFALLGINPRQVGSPDKNPKAHKQAVDIFKAAIDPDFASMLKDAGTPAPSLVGRKVALEATVVATAPSKDRPEGGKFTRHAWTPAPKTAAT